jgi:hypothetical protein
MDPWPTDCQVCHEPLRGPVHEDHEPPLRWLRDHPDYDGPLVLRPSHPACNLAKGKRPDWERYE